MVYINVEDYVSSSSLEVHLTVTTLDTVTRIFALNPNGKTVWVPRNYLRRGSLANVGLRPRSLSRESALPSESRPGRLYARARNGSSSVGAGLSDAVIIIFSLHRGTACNFAAR